ncbi:MAG: flippase, partial [Parcubacteria group bacterium]|nr:flippase [Parcubacteria group bacterium]
LSAVYQTQIFVGLAVGIGVLIPLSLTQLFGGVFQHHFHFERIGIAESIGRLVQLGGVWYVSYHGGSVVAYIVAAALGAVITLGATLLWLRPYVRLRLRFSPKQFTGLLHEAWPLAVSTASILVYFKVDTILLSVLVEARDVGYYNIAYKIFETILFFPALIAGLVLPLLAGARTERAHFQHIMRRALQSVFLVCIPAVAGLAILSRPVVVLIAGSEFLPASPSLEILAVALLAVFPAHILSHAIIALGKQRDSMKAYITGAVVNVGLNLVIIPLYSFIGASWTTLATELGVTAWLLGILLRGGYVWVSPKDIAQPMIATLAMVGVLLVMPEWHVAVQIAAGVCVYAAVLVGVARTSLTEMYFFFLRVPRGIHGAHQHELS